MADAITSISANDLNNFIDIRAANNNISKIQQLNSAFSESTAFNTAFDIGLRMDETADLAANPLEGLLGSDSLQFEINQLSSQLNSILESIPGENLNAGEFNLIPFNLVLNGTKEQLELAQLDLNSGISSLLSGILSAEEQISSQSTLFDTSLFGSNNTNTLNDLISSTNQSLVQLVVLNAIGSQGQPSTTGSLDLVA
jgi:hypothetical protein